MEQNFQTSFMPKKPMIEERSKATRPIGLFSVLAMFIFFSILLASGGLFFYKGIMSKNISQMKVDLDRAKTRFEPAKIVQLQTLDKRLRASTEVLGNHISISPVFDILQANTEKTVRYTKFTYSADSAGASVGTNAKVTFKLEGQATGYKAIALQSDLFTKDSRMIDPVFSNLILDDKGNVNFQLSFSVDPALIDYQNMLKTQSAEQAGGNNITDFQQ